VTKLLLNITKSLYAYTIITVCDSIIVYRIRENVLMTKKKTEEVIPAETEGVPVETTQELKTEPKKNDIVKISEVTREEVISLVENTMDENLKQLLPIADNRATLEGIVDNQLHNPHIIEADADVALVVANILRKFQSKSFSGNLKEYILLGSRDRYSGKKSEPFGHDNYFIRLINGEPDHEGINEDGIKTIVEKITLFDSTPNPKVKIPWVSGARYTCEIGKSKRKNASGEILTDMTGTPIMNTHIRDYRQVNDPDRDKLAHILKSDLKLTNSAFKQMLGNGASPEMQENFPSQILYKTAALEFVINDIQTIIKSIRKENEDGTWGTSRLEKDGELIEQSLLQPNDAKIMTLVCKIIGEIKLSDKFTLVLYVDMDRQHFGQMFYYSPTLRTVLERPTFAQSQPEHQADWLAMNLRGKKVRILGDMTSLSFKEDGSIGFMNISPVSLVEMDE
jgi:hypothetical protein